MTNKPKRIALVSRPRGTMIGRRAIDNGVPIVSGGVIYVTTADLKLLKTQLLDEAKAKLGRQTEADDQEDDMTGAP